MDPEPGGSSARGEKSQESEQEASPDTHKGHSLAPADSEIDIGSVTSLVDNELVTNVAEVRTLFLDNSWLLLWERFMML